MSTPREIEVHEDKVPFPTVVLVCGGGKLGGHASFQSIF